MNSTVQWPDTQLDIADLVSGGWRPIPFREFVLKVHQRCNLSCEYCYVYAMADQSWRNRPVVMPPLVWRAAAERIAEHARTHELGAVRVILHGGEPLLAGRERLLDIVAGLRAALPTECRLRVGLQTNAVLLDEATLTDLCGNGIEIGVSLDGTEDGNERRRRPDGRSSYAAVQAGLRLLGDPRYRDAFAGLLCVVNPATDPVACYEALLQYAPPSVDFLLPHANWSRPPALLNFGVRPNSPITTTSVSSSRPRSCRSPSRAERARSVGGSSSSRLHSRC